MSDIGDMRHSVTPYILTQARTARGGVSEEWAAQPVVWGGFVHIREDKQISRGRDETPATEALTIWPADWAVAGARVEVRGTLYDVVAVDTSGARYNLSLREVT